MEAAIVLISCAFATFCTSDGTCTEDTPQQLSVEVAEGGDTFLLRTTPDRSGTPHPARVVGPLPTARGEPLSLFFGQANIGAYLLTLRNAPESGETWNATLRFHPNASGDVNGAGALTSEALCTLIIEAP